MNHKKISECRKNSIVGVEQRLFDAAAGLPEPGTGFSQIEAKIRETGKAAPGRTLTAEGTEPQNALDGRISHRSGRMGRKILSGGRPAAVWKAAAAVIAVLLLGGTTVLAASPQLREAVIRFFSFGTVEKPPVPELQETGSLTMTQSVTLDSHFRAMYISSPDYVSTKPVSDGSLMLQVSEEDGIHYYTVKDGILAEPVLENHMVEGSVDFGILPGVMTESGAAPYDTMDLPAIPFALDWQQSDTDIYLNPYTELYGRRFDIGTACGVDLGDDFDGCFYFSSVPGRTDIVIGTFEFDAQRTSYSYPFLVDLDTGRTQDLFAAVDFSAYPCITELRLEDNLQYAMAMAGEDMEHLREVVVDLKAGTVTEAYTTEEGDAFTPPVEDCFSWFVTGEHTLFYAVGDIDTGLDGYLYDSTTKESTLLFADTAWNYNIREDGYAERYINMLGGGYGLYREADKVFLLNLKDGSRMLLEGVPVSHNVSFFFNRDYTLLSYEILEDGEALRLGFIDPQKEEAWYFDREPGEGIHEEGASWYSDCGYVIHAANEARDMYYLYLYEYMP